MYADDRVLVGVVKRKRDYEIARQDLWYRIPQAQMPDGINAEYLALFLSRGGFGDQGGMIAAFARITGYELARRADLLPGESRRADQVYYRIQFRRLIEKNPPIVRIARAGPSASFARLGIASSRRRRFAISTADRTSTSIASIMPWARDARHQAGGTAPE